VTKLDKPLRREIEIDSRLYTLVLGPHRLKLTPKGRRQGIEVPWPELLAITEREQPELGFAVPLGGRHASAAAAKNFPVGRRVGNQFPIAGRNPACWMARAPGRANARTQGWPATLKLIPWLASGRVCGRHASCSGPWRVAGQQGASGMDAMEWDA
jgi:hypothetical protein